MMARRKCCLVLCFCTVLFGVSECSSTTPPGVVLRGETYGASDFQSSVQQQSFTSILTSIEARLRNLDSIYSMQLARSLDLKLDHYNRKLDSLDTKITRLEAMVMLNLDKISENISTKNFKDDMSRTNVQKKMDTMYEGISHRLSYMDRKHDANFMMMQEKIDSAIERLEKIEALESRRETEVEGSFSEIVYAIEDFKSNYSEIARKIENKSSEILNGTKDINSLINRYHIDGKRSLSKFHDNIIANLEYIDNKTSEHYKVSDDTNGIVKNMKAELKNDFNSYANKVADMTNDIWKKGDVRENDLKQVAVIVNQTRVEVQNGVRSIMVQIGRMTNKRSVETNDQGCSEIYTKLDDNFGKILSNQEVFLASCHRLQMDESHIEAEIGQVLEKLIDMIEIKLANDSQSMRNFRLFLKSHDSRVKRNVFHTNQNIVTLFEQSTRANQIMSQQVGNIRHSIDAINHLIHTINSKIPAKSDYERIISSLSRLEQYTASSTMNITTQLEELLNISYMVTKIIDNEPSRKNIPKNIDDLFGPENNKTEEIVGNTPTNVENKIDEKINKTILDIFGQPPSPSANPEDNLNKTIVDIFGTPSKPTETTPTTTKCQNYIRLIDVRNGFNASGCEDLSAKVAPKRLNNAKRKQIRKKKAKNIHSLIDIRGNFDSEDGTEAANEDIDDANVDNEESTTEPTTEVTDSADTN